jgi:hypothetical protein
MKTDAKRMKTSVLWFSLMLGFSLLPFAARAESLRAGVARIDVTPTQPVMLAGYAERKHPFAGIHDPLSARALAFDEDGARLVLVSLDTCGLYNHSAESFRQAILEASGLKPSELFLCATHNHSAPALTFDSHDATLHEEDTHAAPAQTRDPAPAPSPNAEYTQQLQSNLVTVVRTALSNLTLVRIGSGSGASPVGVSRRVPVTDNSGRATTKFGRNPEAMVDHEVQVLEIVRAEAAGGAQAGEVAAVLFAYPSHSTALAAYNNMVTGDLHGMAAQFLDHYLGKGEVTLPFAGASGDIDPFVRRNGFYTNNGWVPESVLLSTLLGEEVALVLDKVPATLTRCSIRTAFKTITLPGKPRGGSSPAETPAVPFNLTVARLGDMAFVGFGGEMFNEFGRTIKTESPFHPTFVLTHCNGAAGYFPTQASFPAGGYEVGASRCAAGAGEQIVTQALQMLKELQ